LPALSEEADDDDAARARFHLPDSCLFFVALVTRRPPLADALRSASCLDVASLERRSPSALI